MKHFLSLIFLIVFGQTHAQELKVMSYNIKLDYPKEGKNSWNNRKPFFVNQLKYYGPDVFGVQEALPNQMKDIDSLMPAYGFVGVGRDNGSDEGEYSAIFYKKEVFDVVQSSTFWLSETPGKVSMGWDAVCNRVCTYVLLKAKTSNKQFWVFNTHFDHIGEKARVNSAVLILQKIKNINTKDYPVVLMGDFNMEETHKSITLIKQDLNDSKLIANLTFGPEGTFNGFKFEEPVTNRIDFIFVSPDIFVNKYAILSDNWNCQYPSDHLPVLVNIAF
ncbi:MAG: endonuclease/exonuclease/phosphatase family protein [Flavobacteriaceae bacterium]